MKKLPKQFEYIAVEGPVGVGKTSFSRILAGKLNARIVLENVEDNPFLSDFYQNPNEFAFITQINFLFMRYEQLRKIIQRDLFQTRTVTDFIFWKDRIFACVNLAEREFALYEKIAHLLVKEVPVPDLVIYLQSPLKRIADNIEKRSKGYESNISEEYLKVINEAYNQYFFGYDSSPLLVVNISEIDFVRNPDEINNIIDFIKTPFSGTKYFNPKGR